MSEKTLRICHLYPDLLNLYGDRGNILCMRRRLEWRGIGAEVTEVTVGEQADFTQFDLFFNGGGQDFEQEVLLSDLKAGKGREKRHRKLRKNRFNTTRCNDAKTRRMVCIKTNKTNIKSTNNNANSKRRRTR